ncbi:MAG: protein kinase [Polyangiaceae bacterium]
MDTECSKCGTRLRPDGGCGVCLLGLGLVASDPPDLVGERVGPFQISRILGQGGTGVVYEAVDTRPESPRFHRFHRSVALKILVTDVASTDVLFREAQILAALEHENIVPVYDSGDDGGVAYLVMKLVDGGPVATPAESPVRAAEIALRIARAIDFAHRHGVLHRDLKPGNVLVDARGGVFVTDFGLAARAHHQEDTSFDSTRVEQASFYSHPSGGTPAYVAPEVWMDAPGAASTAADVWSIGAVLFELCAGQPPFGFSLEDLPRRIAEDSAPPLEGVPPDLAAICARCLRKEPSERYASAGEIALDLERFLRGDEVRARPRGPGERLLRRIEKHPVFGLLVVLTVLLTGVTLWRHVAAVRASEAAALSRMHAQQATFRAADFAARRAADLAALQFDRYVAAVDAAAQDPEVLEAARNPAHAGTNEVCFRLLTDALAPTMGPFEGWFLLDADGWMVGRAPDNMRPTVGRNYAFRDYYSGALENERRGIRRAYVSRVYRSEGDDGYQIAIATVLHDDAGRRIGFIVAGLMTGSTLGSLSLQDPNEQGFTVSILAPRGPERDPSASDGAPLFILHRDLGRGAQLSAQLGGGAVDGQPSSFARIVPVRGTPFSAVVRVDDEDGAPPLTAGIAAPSLR